MEIDLNNTFATREKKQSSYSYSSNISDDEFSDISGEENTQKAHTYNSTASSSDEPEIINSDIEDVEGSSAHYFRKQPGRPPKYKEYDDIPKDMLFGTEYVAQILGLSSQAIRNYCDDFEDFLHIRRKETGHRQFTQEDINNLRRIIKIKDERNFTVKQMKAYLENPTDNAMVPDEVKMEQLLLKVKESVNETVLQLLSEIKEQNTLALEDKNNAINEASEKISEMTSEIAKQKERIIEIENLLKHQSEENAVIIDELKKSNELKESEISELLKNSKTQLEQLEAIKDQTKAKKKFLGIF